MPQAHVLTIDDKYRLRINNPLLDENANLGDMLRNPANRIFCTIGSNGQIRIIREKEYNTVFKNQNGLDQQRELAIVQELKPSIDATRISFTISRDFRLLTGIDANSITILLALEDSIEVWPMEKYREFLTSRAQEREKTPGESKSLGRFTEQVVSSKVVRFDGRGLA